LTSKLQSIFQSFKKRPASHSYSPHKTKVIDAISRCRTPQMGGFAQHCSNCDYTETHFHSCRNRHCPICQSSNQHKWVEKQVSNTLPLPYFHAVFTLPSELNLLILANPVKLYNLLFKATSKTILTLSMDKKFLGGQPGFTTVLHTWGRNLQFHPHIHCIVAGGCLSTNKNSFIKSKETFFLPVSVMKIVFRGKFLQELKTLFIHDRLVLPDDLSSIDQRQKLLDKLYNVDWITYCKKPFDDASHVIRYLGRYTHKVAISESRIVSYDTEAQKVCFNWKDYKNQNKIKTMELSEEEFVRRFLLHVLPSGFMKIRHYGFLANKGRKDRLALCRRLLNMICNKVIDLVKSKVVEPLACCPKCGNRSYDFVFPEIIHNTEVSASGGSP